MIEIIEKKKINYVRSLPGLSFPNHHGQKAEIQHVSNRRTDLLITIIELLHFLNSGLSLQEYSYKV